MDSKRRCKKTYIVFGGLMFLVLGVWVLFRFSIATDHLYHALVKDPERVAPGGPVVVAPADGTVLYIERIRNGEVPEVVKKGVRVPVIDHLKMQPIRPMADGYLIGIYMNTHGVHINRVPNHGEVVKRLVYNGPHMNMTKAESKIILSQLVPGLTTMRKALGLDPFGIEDDADYILKSARESLAFRDERGRYLYVVRIADYYVGKILTWVNEGEQVQRGQKLGMITWGSQTDLLIEATPGMTIETGVGEYVYGGETVLARY